MNTLPAENYPVEEPVLDQERQRTAREYSRIRRRLGFGEMLLSLGLLLLLIFSGISSWFTGLLNLPFIARVGLYFLALMAAYELLTFPLGFYSGYTLPHRYGISVQKLKSWLADLAKSAVLGLVLGLAAIAVVYWLFQSFPDFWWLLAWLLVLAVSLLMSVIAPVLLVPLFYKMKPLTDAGLKDKLERLARKAGAAVNGVFILDFSTKVTSANAGLMGLGRTRRIVISDTLLKQYSTPEIEVITAHELGHHHNRDISRLFIIQSVLYLILFKIADIVLKATVAPLEFHGIADPATLPWLILIFGVLTTLISPLTNTYTRHVEGQADRFALRLTDNPRAFINAMTRLTNQNLAIASPAGWEEILFYDHPSYSKRVQMAREHH